MTATLSVKLLKYINMTRHEILDDMRVIWDDNESDYRRDLNQLISWCCHNNLELNTLKIVDFKKNPITPSPLIILNSTVSTFQVSGNNDQPGPKVGD